ncbi:MAG: DUF1501 domain-containing protein [Planctomycetota bacterium]|jgi:Protein of unknown function (DUF1501)|nr:DUF1501 domain-containing protein [Planctomycetia bacterium]MDO7678664.1 DUF1501 domain-containing protein [Pirellulales bacterium]RLS21449.1 MAG: DUF1501 domain-containing protein [Planctomycetota bacterium]RLS29018.1 MAG: DUF1501 domain-containing protein [Planctomycetota bacterium]
MKCPGNLLARRGFLSVGAIGGLGLTLADFFRMEKAQADIKNYASKEGTAKSIIYIYLPGGCAHQETFDPKPFAPVEYRGPLNSIESNVSGIRVGELLPNTAKIVDKIAICRSMTHGEAAHERGTHNMFTGYRPSPALQYPSMGSVVSHEFGPRNNLPPYVCIPGQPNEFAGTGYLSSSYAGFSLGSDPADAGFKVKDLSLPGGVDVGRFEKRRRMLDVVNDHFRQKEKSDSLDALDTFYDRAYSLISSEKARDAFDMSKETDAVKDEYGRNTAGLRMLLARRLVESGVRFVTLTYGGWDMHDNIAGNMKAQLPAFDQGFATLIRDLDRRGLLASTMVCVGSEFGRTPKINATAGRDHWPKVFSVVMAGGGIKGGIAYGTSNATASEPEDNPLTVEDWATTIYDRLGIVADKELMAPGDRPIEIVDGGKVRKELLS